MRGRGFLASLVLATALGPLSIHIFLPAVPSLRETFGVGAGLAQLALSSSMFAMGLSMLCYGPLSDRFGRRPMLLAGHLLFIAGSAVCALATQLEWLLAGRVIQAAGAISGVVLARAIVRDAYPPAQVSSVYAALAGAMAVAPMLAPSIGGFVTSLSSWRAIFVLSGAVGLVSLLLVLRYVPETRVAGSARLGALVGFAELARSRTFRRYGLQGAFAAAAFLTFVSAAPYLMTPTEYGLYFMLLAGSFIVGSGFAARRSEQYGMERMVGTGMAGMLLSVALMATGLALGFAHPLALFLPAMLLTFAQGLAIPNSQAGAIGAVPERAGTASGLSGFLNQWMAAGFTQAVGMLQDGSALPMVALCATCALCATLCFVGLRERGGRPA